MKEFIRRLLRRLVCAFLCTHSQSYGTLSSGRCVVVAPHQDDETLGCAGLILHQRAAGIPVSIVYLTDGSGSHPGHPRLDPAAIAKIRRYEAVRAMQLLHVDAADLHFLDARDGTLSHLAAAETDALVRRLSAIFTSLQPTQLFAACRDDSSAEHTGAFDLTARALQEANLQPRLLEYPVWARWRPQHLLRIARASRQVWRLQLSPEKRDLKRAAIDTYVSQTTATPPWPQPVLPHGFAACFNSPEEFFFER